MPLIALTLPDTDRNLAAIRSEYAPLAELVRQKGVEDITVNADGALWVNRTGIGFSQEGRFPPETAAKLLARLATLRGVMFSPSSPVIETESPLGDGSRITGVMSPVVRGTILAIRPLPKITRTIQDYIDTGVVAETQAAIILAAIRNRRNIVVSGAAGSGKTTFLNMLVNTVAIETPDDRVIAIEDTAELCLTPIRNSVSMLSTTVFGIDQCLKAALRLTGHRLFVGEVRDKAALTLLTAWNTGQAGGLATVHADDALLTLQRLEQITPLPDRRAKQLISQAVNLVFFMARDPKSQAGRRLVEIVSVRGYNVGRDEYEYDVL